jgi:hypothetical protein
MYDHTRSDLPSPSHPLSEAHDMHTRNRSLGARPRCRASTPSAAVLIECGTTDGSTVYAECPARRDVVHPT